MTESSPDAASHEQLAVPSDEELAALLDAADIQLHLATGAAQTEGLAVQYRIEPGDRQWWWSTRDGEPATGVGMIDDPDVVVTCDPRTARGLLEGTLEVSRAFLLGRLRVEGELGSALDDAAAHRPAR